MNEPHSKKERIELPWRFFWKRWIVILECNLAVILALLFIGVEAENMLGMGIQSFALAFIGFAFVGSAGLVRWVTLAGPALRYRCGRAERSIDLAKVTLVGVKDDDWFVPRLLIYEGGKEPTHSLPLIGESGRRILDHVLAHIPEAAKPQVIETLLKPYKPGLFRPREESLPLPEAQ